MQSAWIYYALFVWCWVPSSAIIHPSPSNMKDFPPSLFAHAGFLVSNASAQVRLQYWFFPTDVNLTSSKSQGVVAPTVLWLNGGPGCSDAMGLFYENGPFSIDPATMEVKPNPYTWQRSMNMLYIDSPCGTGYSECGSAGFAKDEARIASDLFNALENFFRLPNISKLELRKSEFFIMGESYAGKYIPFLASYLVSHPSPLFPALTGIAIGNGMIDPLTQVSVYADFAYNTQLCDANQAAKLRDQQKQVVDLIKAGDYTKANNVWGSITTHMLEWAGWPDPSDIRFYGFSRLDFHAAEKFMELAFVRSQLGVPTNATRNFTMCSGDVQAALAADEMRSVKHLLVDLLDNTNIRVLLFTGNFDPALPVPETWISSIGWSQQGAFNAAPRTVWKNKAGNTAGYTKSVGGLTFTVVVQAGHMAVMDQPENTLEMAESFVFQSL